MTPHQPRVGRSGPALRSTTLVSGPVSRSALEPSLGRPYHPSAAERARVATIDVGTAKGTILNDDPAPWVAIGDAKRTEGDSTGTPTRMLVPVALSATAGVPVTLHYDTVGYCSAGGPFVSFKGRCDEQHGAVEFPADDGSTQLITIPIW